jgi:myo-inositol 2-dehydrogenase / D-chiro-inositol 1-dehydrogenase
MHNIDVINWYTGKHPVKAVGFGSRQRRPTGDQYDNFSVDFVFDDGMHMHSMCRQINGCTNNVSEFIMGTKGKSNCQNKIEDLNGNTIFEFNFAQEDQNIEGRSAGVLNVNPYDQEIIDLVAAIRNNTPFNEVELCATSTMVAIMGRMSSYTGREVTWDEVMNSNMRLGPDNIQLGYAGFKSVIPVPGTA